MHSPEATNFYGESFFASLLPISDIAIALTASEHCLPLYNRALLESNWSEGGLFYRLPAAGYGAR